MFCVAEIDVSRSSTYSSHLGCAQIFPVILDFFLMEMMNDRAGLFRACCVMSYKEAAL